MNHQPTLIRIIKPMTSKNIGLYLQKQVIVNFSQINIKPLFGIRL